jgi:hypothetical protein
LTTYEDILSDPAGFIRKVCTAMGLDAARFPFDQLNRVPIVGSSSLSKKGKVTWEPQESDNRFKPVGHWRSWSPWQKLTFKAIVGNILSPFGYGEETDW